MTEGKMSTKETMTLERKSDGLWLNASFNGGTSSFHLGYGLTQDGSETATVKRLRDYLASQPAEQPRGEEKTYACSHCHGSGFGPDGKTCPVSHSYFVPKYASQPKAATDAQVACPECFGSAFKDHDSVSCDACEKLWPLSQHENVRLETVRKRIEKAVTEHCAGGDLYLTTWLAAKDVAHPAPSQDVGAAGDGVAEDTVLLNALSDNCWDLRSFNIFTGQGDGDYGWEVYEHVHLLGERVIATSYGDDPREAIRKAMLAAATEVPQPPKENGDE